MLFKITCSLCGRIFRSNVSKRKICYKCIKLAKDVNPVKEQVNAIREVLPEIEGIMGQAHSYQGYDEPIVKYSYDLSSELPWQKVSMLH